MPPIIVKHYYPPHGEHKQITVEVDPDTYLKAEKLVADGFTIEAELLSTGEISWTIGNVAEEEDVAYNIVSAETDRTEAVTKLIQEFDV